MHIACISPLEMLINLISACCVLYNGQRKCIGRRHLLPDSVPKLLVCGSQSMIDSQPPLHLCHLKIERFVAIDDYLALRNDYLNQCMINGHPIEFIIGHDNAQKSKAGLVATIDECERAGDDSLDTAAFRRQIVSDLATIDENGALDMY